MVVSSKYIVVCFLSAIAFSVWAGQTKSPDKIHKENQVIDFTYKKMRRTIERLEKKIDECSKSGIKTNLDPALLQLFTLTADELRTVFLRFAFLALNKCEGINLWEQATRDFSQFKYVEKFYKGKNFIKTENTFEQICCGEVISNIEVELKYLNIAPEIRRKLENIPELQRPFNVFQLLEAD